jgi:uncharacterized protein GlcG (DUF336 family)
MKLRLIGYIGFFGSILSAVPSYADQGGANCAGLPSPGALRNALKNAGSSQDPTAGPVGGLFNGSRMWAAVVNRSGELCAAVTSTPDPTQVWPGSQAIAKSKAYTANAFSLDNFALSTARLYTFSQPGHSLWSLFGSNGIDPQSLSSPTKPAQSAGKITGGQIYFGGGVPIYSNGKIVGGLGVSGDTSCADHEVAKRVRDSLGMNPAGGAIADDIKYSSVDGATVFTHPLCIHTWRNGIFVGEEPVSSGY